MPDMRPEKTTMSEQSPDKRVLNFSEVALGYSPEEAMAEARRCLQCKHKPCIKGCPVAVPIPEFIALVAEGDFDAAYDVIMSENRLPAICGRVCPQETQCEQVCVRGIKHEPVAIGRLERFVADYAMQQQREQAASTAQGAEDTAGREKSNDRKQVAVVGSGPAGITCAGELAQRGYSVTVFEALHSPGGVLVYGIPEFRLPKKLVAEEIDNIARMDVDIQPNVIIGRSLNVDDLLDEEGFAAVFVGSGAGLPSFLRIEGENLRGVYSANEFLTRSNLMQAYRFPEVPTPIRVGEHAAVVGGGNVAMDAARTALRLGAKKVSIVYRRSEKELPARAEEVEHAREEGVNFELLTNPVRILGQGGAVTSLECVRMELGEPDASGRRRPVPIADSNFTFPVDTVVVAIGGAPNPLIRQTTDQLDTQPWGGIVVDEESMATSREGVFAGGDIVTGAATVILAMGAGKKAAAAIDEYLAKQ